MPNAPEFNEASVRSGIKQILVDNASEFMIGLEHFGQSRTIGQITTSNLTPPIGKYYVQVFIPRVRNEPTGQSSTGRNQPTQNVYTVVITIADEAQVSRSELEAYEDIHTTFTTFTDRVINLLQDRNNVGFVLDNPKSRFRQGSLVEKIDLSTPNYDKTKRLWASLWCELRFELVQTC